jgi:hypothetical protein
VRVPFTLPAEAQNEGQFAFTVKNINMSQKLKGTVVYIVKVSTSLKRINRVSSSCVSFYSVKPA